MNFKSYFNENNNQYDIVYHVSPRSDMFKLRDIGSKRGTRAYIGKKQSGIYVAPKFRDAVAWAATYVAFKKEKNQKPNERLREKGGGHHGEKGPREYKNLTIYEIRVPKEILRKVNFNTYWEPEYFIPKEYMEHLEIVKSRTYSKVELELMYNREIKTRQNYIPQENKSIKDVSKTNLAAKYYLELNETYNNLILSKKAQYNEKIKEEIEKLKKHIVYYDENNNMQYKIKLDRRELLEVNDIYNKVKNMIKGE